MTTKDEDRKFRLALTIKEHDANVPGAHVVIIIGDEPDRVAPVMAIEAGGFPTSEEGAAMLAEMFEDAASAIREYLTPRMVQRVHVSTDTSELPAVNLSEAVVPSVPARPRFNPQPRGQR